MNFADEDDEPEFPGYEERLDEIEEEIRQFTRKKIELDASRSVEVLGKERASFHLREDTQINLSAIYEKFKQEGLRNFSDEELKNLLSQGEIIAFLTQIEVRKRKSDHDDEVDQQEADLVEYIKYLVGESKNDGFEFKREDFS